MECCVEYALTVRREGGRVNASAAAWLPGCPVSIGSLPRWRCHLRLPRRATGFNYPRGLWDQVFEGGQLLQPPLVRPGAFYASKTPA